VASLFHVWLLDQVTKLYITSLSIVGIHSRDFKNKILDMVAITLSFFYGS